MPIFKPNRISDKLRSIRSKVRSDHAVLRIAATEPHLIVNSHDPRLSHAYASQVARRKPDVDEVLDSEERVLSAGEFRR